MLALWSNTYVAAGQQLIDHGMAQPVDCLAAYAMPPRLAIRITDTGRKVRLRKPRV